MLFRSQGTTTAASGLSWPSCRSHHGRAQYTGPLACQARSEHGGEGGPLAEPGSKARPTISSSIRHFTYGQVIFEQVQWRVAQKSLDRKRYLLTPDNANRPAADPLATSHPKPPQEIMSTVTIDERRIAARIKRMDEHDQAAMDLGLDSRRSSWI